MWIKGYASKLALGGFQCSGLSVPDFPELRFHRTRISILAFVYGFDGLFIKCFMDCALNR